MQRSGYHLVQRNRIWTSLLDPEEGLPSQLVSLLGLPDNSFFPSERLIPLKTLGVLWCLSLATLSFQKMDPSGVKVLETAEDIQERRQQVLDRYHRFKELSTLRRQKLEDSYRFQFFQRDAEELEKWIQEKLQIASDENYKDPTNLQVCLISLRFLPEWKGSNVSAPKSYFL